MVILSASSMSSPTGSGFVSSSGSYSFVSSQFNTANNIANSAITSATAFLDELLGLIRSSDVPGYDVDVEDVDVPELDITDFITEFESLPDLTDLVLNMPTMVLPEDMPVFDDSLVRSAFTTMLDKVINTMNNVEETGIDPIEDAIYQRALNRLNDEFNDNVSKAESFYSSRGFPAPPGALAATVAKLDIEHTREVENLNNDIIKQTTLLAQTNLHKMMDYIVPAYETQVRAYTATLDSYKTKVSIYVSLLEAAVKELEAEISKYTAQADLLKSKASVYREYYSALSIRVRMLLEKIRIDADISIAKIKGEIEAYLSEQQMAIEGAKAAGTINSQIASSALSSINAGANVSSGYSGSESKQVSFSQSASESYFPDTP